MEASTLNYIETGLQLAIAIAAFIALRQISITKQLAKTNAKRESIRLTADQCHIYGEKHIPLLRDLDVAIKEHNFRFLTESKIEIDGTTIKVKPFHRYPEHNAAVEKVAPYMAAAYNALNSFALYFVSGVADERYAYTTLGTSYCNSVRTLLPFIVGWSSKTKEDNILRLFTLWNSRKENEENQRELEKLKIKLAQNGAVEIRPIGT